MKLIISRAVGLAFLATVLATAPVAQPRPATVLAASPDLAATLESTIQSYAGTRGRVEIVLPEGSFAYRSLQIQAVADTLVLRGQGGVRVVADASGIPDVVPDCKTTLRVADDWHADYAAGVAAPSRVQIWPENSAFIQYGRGDWNTGARSFHIARTPDGQIDLRVRYVEFRDLCLDGREEAAVSSFKDAGPAWLDVNLRDGAAHSAILAGAESGTYWCLSEPLVYQFDTNAVIRFANNPGLGVLLDGVTLTGYTATGLLGGQCTRFKVERSFIDRSAYNHSVYGADGGSPPRVERATKPYSLYQDRGTGPLSGWGGYNTVTLRTGSWSDVIPQFGWTGTAIRIEPPVGPNPFGRDNPEIFAPRYAPITVIRGLHLVAPIGEQGMPRSLGSYQANIEVQPLPADYVAPLSPAELPTTPPVPDVPPAADAPPVAETAPCDDDSLRAEIARLLLRNDELSQAAAMWESTATLYASDLNAVQSERDAALGQIEQLQSTLNLYAADLAGVERERDAAQAELATLRAEYDALIAALRVVANSIR